MIHIQPPAPSTAENYNIDDLSSGDETDDDDRPKKRVPQWAQSGSLNLSLQKQYKTKLSQERVFQVLYNLNNDYLILPLLF